MSGARCSARARPETELLACMQLFDGNTEISEPCQEAIKELLRAEGSTSGPQRIVGMRGFDHMYAHSDLEKICNAVVRQTANDKLGTP